MKTIVIQIDEQLHEVVLHPKVTPRDVHAALGIPESHYLYTTRPDGSYEVYAFDESLYERVHESQKLRVQGPPTWD